MSTIIPSTLRDGFLQSVARHLDRPALEVAGTAWTYRELSAVAHSLAATLESVTSAASPVPLTAVFAYRSPMAYAGVIAALLRGHGYVPLSRLFPAERTATMLELSECGSLVVDRDSAAQLDGVLARVSRDLVVAIPELDDTAAMAARWPRHRFLGKTDLLAGTNWSPRAARSDAPAYLIFTSGSTGTPKGVMISHSNALHLLAALREPYPLTEHDRCSQAFELTFDGSVIDLFLAWSSGACLCVPTQKELIKPGKFIQDSRVSFWFSVPSTAAFMRRLGMLKPGRYPSLRWTLFGGEALTSESARAWAEAAPNGVVDNLYGPTESTVACMRYRWDPRDTESSFTGGVVPIGFPLSGMSALVVDPELREVSPGADGELLIAGPQVAAGYWRDPQRTAASFVVPPGHDRIHYRTGDRVRRPHAGEPYAFLGRLDRQVQVHGHRVELAEVEAALREVAGVDGVVAVGWPRGAAGAAGGVEAFIGASQADPERIRREMAKRLPDYMVPRRLHLLAEFPLTVHGKVDQAALLRLLEDKP